jgi:hypothetical protein
MSQYDNKRMLQLYATLCKIKGEQKEEGIEDTCCKNKYVIFVNQYKICENCGVILDQCMDGNYSKSLNNKRSHSLPYHKQRYNYINRTILKELNIPYHDLQKLKTIINNVNDYFQKQIRFKEKRQYNFSKDFLIYFLLYNMGFKDEAKRIFNSKKNHIIMNYTMIIEMLDQILPKNTC